MDFAANWAQVVSAFGGLAGFTALGIELRARVNRRKRPPEDLLERLDWLHGAFGEIIAHGGRESLWFLEGERRRGESLLAIVGGQIVDDALNGHVGEARSKYNDAFALSPGHGTLGDGHNADRVQKQIDVAGLGRAACTKAIDRANYLLRKYRQ